MGREEEERKEGMNKIIKEIKKKKEEIIEQ